MRQRLAYHVINDVTGGVERARFLARGGAGFLVVAGQQILEHLAEQFRIERHFLFGGGVFLNREDVIVEQCEQATRSVALAPCLVDRVEVDVLRIAEENTVWHVKRVLRMVRKAVDTQPLAIADSRESGIAGEIALRQFAIEAFEQATVKERHLAEQSQRSIGIGEQVLIAVDAVDEEMRVLPATGVLRAPPPVLPTFAHFSVERGEEQVLQDGAIIIAFVRLRTRIVL